MGGAPPLAFLLATKDRHADLARNLPGVLRTAAACGAEVLLCDQSERPFPAPAPARVLHRPGLGGLPAARNLLLAAAAAPLVCFLDDDTAVGADLGPRLVALAAAEPEALGWAPVVELRPRRLRRLHRLLQLGCFRDPRRLAGRRLDAPVRVLPGCCMAFRREAALALGFDERLRGYALGEDLDFCLRLERRFGPGRLRFARALRALHLRAEANRGDPRRRGRARRAFLLRQARRFGGANPATLLHLALAGAAGLAAEPAGWRGLLLG